MLIRMLLPANAISPVSGRADLLRTLVAEKSPTEHNFHIVGDFWVTSWVFWGASRRQCRTRELCIYGPKVASL